MQLSGEGHAGPPIGTKWVHKVQQRGHKILVAIIKMSMPMGRIGILYSIYIVLFNSAVEHDQGI